ncbi:hypothetical protein ACQRBN_08550 [Bariatricus sp. SGI.154]|uniref:hypothetical protein n=1 Tax=Bariatricus sp. SGI.154 TaxID=3420549 RepID=UPI003D011D53
MDEVLKMPMIDIEIVVPWRRILSGILLAVCCLGLYVYGLNQVNSYEEVPTSITSKHPVTRPNAGIHMKNVCASVKMTVDHARNILSEKIEESIHLSVAVSELAAANIPGGAVADSLEELGKDEMIALPNEDASAAVGAEGAADEAGAAGEEQLEISGFICNADGYITGYTDKVSATDGILVIPTDEKCIGIVKGALDGLGEETTEIYIPANISDIEPGVFDRFVSLFYIEVAADNPSYCSRDGILYTKSGGIFAYPNGRPMAGMEYE